MKDNVRALMHAELAREVAAGVVAPLSKPRPVQKKRGRKKIELRAKPYRATWMPNDYMTIEEVRGRAPSRKSEVITEEPKVRKPYYID